MPVRSPARPYDTTQLEKDLAQAESDFKQHSQPSMKQWGSDCQQAAFDAAHEALGTTQANWLRYATSAQTPSAGSYRVAVATRTSAETRKECRDKAVPAETSTSG